MTEPTTSTGPTAEEIAAKKLADKNAREAKKVADNAAKAAEKATKAAEAKAAKDAAAQAKLDAKKAAEDAKNATKMPIQNDVRRPRPETTCGKCWAVYDDLTAQRKSTDGMPAAIADAKKVLEGMGINIATIRTQYAHWRKYNGVTGRVESTAPPVASPAPAVAA